MPNNQSWEAWRIAVLSRMDSLEANHKEIQQELHLLNNMLIEAVGRSGKNGRVGNLETRLDNHEKENKKRLYMGGAVGGGLLAGLVETLRAFFS